MKPTLTEIGKLLNNNEKKSDKHYYGVVQSINYKEVEGKQVVDSYNVSLGGDSGTVKCRKTAGAKLGDKVLVTLLSTGTGIVTNTIGGDYDAVLALDTAEDAMDKADNASEGAADAATRAQEAIDALAAAGVEQNISWNPDTNTFTIGNESFSIRISGNRLGFYYGETEVSYMNGAQLAIANGYFTNEVRVADKWRFKLDADNGLTLQWIG